MERKTARRIISAFSIATLIFLLGLFIGESIMESKAKQILDMSEKVRLEIQDLELQQALSSYDPCGKSYLNILSAQLDEMGTKISFLEETLGKNDAQVLELKKPYTMLMIRHYLLVKQRIEKCNENYITILFFYSNKREYITESEKQGYVLGYFADKYGYEKLKVYSIDADLDLGVVKMLKEQYNITILPTTIINEKVFAGFTEKEKFEEYF